ncbi:MAG: phosphoribosylformylglycinamidine cyclo-ligase, partial [Alphaproteobacteria bacterium]|nr:phosphoribosylformylglycinamidine cyclo-ligase [Alphaproteobacteria bacterium]
FAPDRTLGSALLEPTRIYIRSCLALARAGGLRGLAHITGGGLLDNIPRVIPPHCQAALDATAWPLPPVFGWLGRLGALSLDELARTFNCGLGMVAIVSACTAENAMTILRANGETVWPVGRMVSRPEGAPGVTIGGRERAWQS